MLTQAAIVGQDDNGVFHTVGTDAIGHLNVNVAASAGTADLNNTTTTPLLAGQTFTGVSTDVSNFAAVQIGVNADQNSAANGLQIQFSNDNVYWDYVALCTFIANKGITIPSGARAKYFRFVYTNGVVDQTFFRVFTILIPSTTENTKRFLQSPPTADQLAILTQSALVGQAVTGTQGQYYNVTVDPYGRFNNISTGILNDLIVGQRYNQVEVNFSQPSFDNGAVINTTSGSGTATQPGSGAGVYATGAGANGQATGISAQTLHYRPGAAIYNMFTAAFTHPTDSVNPNYQRIGNYNSVDGLYLRLRADYVQHQPPPELRGRPLPRGGLGGPAGRVGKLEVHPQRRP